MKKYNEYILEFVIGGFSSGSRRLVWDGYSFNLNIIDYGYQDLKADYHFNDNNFPSEEKNIPEKERWKIFWNVMDNINVWKWDKEYFDRTVLDGTQWELLIKRKGRRKRRIFGSNDYPKEDKGLLKLQAAINELIDDDFFDINDEE